MGPGAFNIDGAGAFVNAVDDAVLEAHPVGIVSGKLA